MVYIVLREGAREAACAVAVGFGGSGVAGVTCLFRGQLGGFHETEEHHVFGEGQPLLFGRNGARGGGTGVPGRRGVRHVDGRLGDGIEGHATLHAPVQAIGTGRTHIGMSARQHHGSPHLHPKLLEANHAMKRKRRHD
mmetsp:Transcript_15720/g.28599  ORF Transcript_15720/g.28599 Transcript_15720/m.28599 type:complete len:138 (+) Transcript_15720:2055-2468(+)